VGFGADACRCGEGCLTIRPEALVTVLKEERVGPNGAKLVSNTLRSHISFYIYRLVRKMALGMDQ
jgi:hypothetical protein